MLIANILVYDYTHTPSKVYERHKMQTPKDQEAFDYLFGEPDEVYTDFEGPIPGDEKEKKG